MTGKLAVYRRLFSYLRPYKTQVSVTYLAMLGATLLNLFVPQVIKQTIDQGLEQKDPWVLFGASALILGIALVRVAAGFVQRYWGEWLTHRTAYDLRDDYYIALQRLPFSFYDRSHTGDLMSRATGDIAETERFAGIGLLELTSVILLIAGVVASMFWQNWQLALLALGPVLALVGLGLRFGMVVRPMFQRIQEQLGMLSTVMQESMTGIGVVKAFAREPHEFAKFDDISDEWFRRRMGVIRTWGDYWPLFTFVLAVGVFLMLWFGGAMVIDGAISVGTLFAMISYLLMLNGPAQQLGNLVNLAATASASASRVFEIIDTPIEIEDAPDAVALPQIEGRVTLEHVSFAYQSSDRVLHDIHFEAPPGKTIALVGPTGSGKSTVVSLLPRFYDPSGGRVLIDGIDVRTIQLQSLRSHIGMVLQEPFLFSTTIRENIAYGIENVADDEVITAAKAANAHDFIMRFPDGYATHVGERGVTLSGGQRQRVAIARALLYNPKVLILDDSTSSVDTQTEHLIQEALATLMRNRTTFIIAQRMVTLKNADCIYVLDGGRIAQHGTHEELLREDGLYRTIYDLQLKAQEEYMREAVR
ncbi:ABC transporter ATP-binding protein [Caldilinea sp.]|uniref:ABC transporter ATP-binding protein n=1 Tax=Caldilinea sp. TaxID=2293560 RepID=UPI002CE4F7E6|nr:ABC transporter ATP-binding protein [Anaerolineales bacterium]HQY94059.1 ABC transporter ATP-binding protein [Caldilinea sp.]